MARSRRKTLPSEPVSVRVESLSHDGRGVAHVEGKTVFVSGVLPDESVLFTYVRQRRNYDEGIVHQVLEASPDRVDPRCPHFGVCGGCSLQHVRSEAQIGSKQRTLLDALERIGKVQPEHILPPLSAESAWGYRRKARLGVKYVAKKGKVLVGFRERGNSFVADLSRCEVLHPKVGGLIEALGEMINGLKLRDKIPQIELSMGDECCVLIFRLLESLSAQDRQLLEQFEQVHPIRVYTQEAGLESVQPLFGESAKLSYKLPEYNLRYRFLPNDFTQVNLELNRLMVHRAVALLDPQPDERVLDLFCGIGNFTLPLARYAAQVTGIEGDAGLVARARANAESNGISNTTFYTANLYDELTDEPWLQESFPKLLLDPPRSGALEILPYIPGLGTTRVVYVSCYPGTLARDADQLVNTLGFRLRAAGVMDMFPHTAHVESIAVFERA